jgi:hypothetical protein
MSVVVRRHFQDSPEGVRQLDEKLETELASHSAAWKKVLPDFRSVRIDGELHSEAVP